MKGKSVNADRIEQCKADIAKLQEELKRLGAEPEPRHGDVVRTPAGRIRVVGRSPEGWRVSRDEGDMVISDRVRRNYASGTYTVIGNVFDWARER